jgi:hypothetical protein
LRPGTRIFGARATGLVSLNAERIPSRALYLFYRKGQIGMAIILSPRHLGQALAGGYTFKRFGSWHFEARAGERMRSEETGTSTASPFVYFLSGTPIYPPNTIYESARIALASTEHKSLREGLKALAKERSVAGRWTVPPEGWWYHFLLTYVEYFGNNFSEPQEMENSAVETLKLMMRTPPEAAWLELARYNIGDIDNLSGWTKSWVKSSTERYKVFKGEDGNYYYHDFDGTLIHIIGAKTTVETHLDLVTDQIIRNYGCLRKTFNVFSAFAIAYAFERDPSPVPSLDEDGTCRAQIQRHIAQVATDAVRTYQVNQVAPLV